MQRVSNLSATMRAIRTGLAMIAVIVCAAAPLRAQSLEQARRQFEKAVALRTELESRPAGQRSLDAYKQAIAAYKKVYLISSQAEEVTPSLIATAELYVEMGREYDPQYFKFGIDAYNFLLKEYPHSRYAAASQLAIVAIQRDDLKDTDAAESTLKDFVERFPKSPKIAAARNELNQIAQARKDAEAVALSTRALQPAAVGPAAAELSAPEPSSAPINPIEGGAEAGLALVTNVRVWNADNYTRVVLDLGDSVKYKASRIGNPDRIFFDVYDANLAPGLAQRSIDVQNGFLKAVRAGQNKAGVVRIVLDVNVVKQYSAYLLQNPYRLVIDAHGNSRSESVAPGHATTAPSTSIPAVANSEGKQLKVYSAAPGQPKATEKTASAMVGPEPVDRLPLRPAFGHNRDIAALVPAPTRDGQPSLTRALGLKINRIVIDPGHGGHDTGTVGPHGLMEKDLCLDVALRLGKMIQERLTGAEVVYTREDDTFIPLEERTAIANQAKADLFISVHANSSRDHDARGVETYYLNFATSQDAMEVAARENAMADTGLHDLQNMIQKIARNEKIEESKELAGDIQDSLTKRLQQVNRLERNRGVKKAPFVVLIGANMPSVLAEISFLSNATDEKMLRSAAQRQRIAEGLFKGVTSYLDSLNSLSYNQQKPLSSPQDSYPLDSVGNPK